MFHSDAEVRELAGKLGEGFSKADLTDTERMYVALYLFFRQATEQGRAVISGIS
jgi:hypothetical protein